jgi:hypothetical protein
MPAVLTLEEARRVLKAADDNRCPWMGFRNRAIVAVLLFCGLRRQELADVKISDIDLRSRWLKVRKGKGGKGRSIPLAPETADAKAPEAAPASRPAPGMPRSKVGCAQRSAVDAAPATTYGDQIPQA